MSATNRGADREIEDSYYTPGWAAERFLEAFSIPLNAVVCDPCAGDGKLLEALKKLRPDLLLYAFELKESEQPALEALKLAGVIEDYGIGDFFPISESIDEPPFDYVITNPPYSLAKEMILASMKVAKVAVCHLLRVNFLGAKKRQEFHRATTPGLFILPDRPCFTGWGSDATEYAWFVYGIAELAGRWQMLGLTPLAILKAAKDAAKTLYPHLNPKLVKERKAAKKAAKEAATLAAATTPAALTAAVIARAPHLTGS